jgi:hypothetical protein
MHEAHHHEAIHALATAKTSAEVFRVRRKNFCRSGLRTIKRFAFDAGAASQMSRC